MDKQDGKDEAVITRITATLKRQFESAAKKDNRSISNALTVAIKDYIRKIDKA